MLSSILLVEAASMIPSMAVAMAHGDGDVLPLFYTALIILAFAVPGFYFVHPKDKNLRVREGFVVVALAWVLMSAFGALPFVFSGFLPHF